MGWCGTGCEDYAACCPGLTGGPPYFDCILTAGGGNNGACADQLSNLVEGIVEPSGEISCSVNGTTGNGGPVCSSLAACCPLLTGGNIGACDEVSAEGDEGACSYYLTLVQGYGFCHG
jgi:hypothetical protein